MSAIVKIQEILGVTPDGIPGIQTETAWQALKAAYRRDLPKPDDGWHSTTATSFADEADLVAFKKCKLEGGYRSRGVWHPGSSDHNCFGIGDNCVGIWGDPTGEGSGPCCALPIAAWHDFYSQARKKLVLVNVAGIEITCELRDSSGTRDVVDLNPDSILALGLKWPLKMPALWKWA